MSVNNNTIIAPVAVDDVMALCGVTLERTVNGVVQRITSNNVGVLCSASIGDTFPATDGSGSWTVVDRVAINQWARFKPVRLTTVKTVENQWDAANNKWLPTSTWWKGLSTDCCGITPATYSTSLPQVLAQYDNGMNGWVYNQPKNGLLHPFRLHDFAGYKHDANPPISNFYIQSQIIQDGDFSASAISNVAPPDGSLSGELLLSDFANGSFSDIYFGVAFTRVVNGAITVYAKATAEEPGEAFVQGDFADATMLPVNTTYTVYPFLCNQRILLSETTEPSGRRYMSCPNLNPLNTTIIPRSSTADILLLANYVSGSQTAATVTIKNNDAISRTNSYMRIMPYTAEAWANPDAYVSTAVYNSGTFTLNASETKTFNVTGLPASSYGLLFVYATFSLGLYSRKTQILQDFSR